MLQSQLQTLKFPSMIQSKKTMKCLRCARTLFNVKSGSSSSRFRADPQPRTAASCSVYSRPRGAPGPLSASRQAAHSPVLVVIQVPQVAAHFHVPLKHNTNPALPPRTSAGPGPAARQPPGPFRTDPEAAAAHPARLTSCMARVRWSELI